VLVSAAKEAEIGREEAQKVERNPGLLDDAELLEYVGLIGARLAEHSPRSELSYSFHVVDLAEPNAFALPGGYVYVSRGLLALVNTEAELAGVIGHEIGHIAARHAVQRAKLAAVTAPVTIATGIAGWATAQLSPLLGRVVAGVGQVAGGLVLAPYSRDQEREADRVGQQIAAEAGWDPRGISTFLRTLEREEELRLGRPRPYSFFASHPTTPDRVSRTAKYAGELTAAPSHAVAKDRRALLAKLDGLLVGDDPAQGLFVETRFLQPDLDFALHFPSEWKTRNERDFVAASAPDGGMGSMLQLVGEGEDPLVVAREVESRTKTDLLDKAETTRVGELRAIHAVEEIRGSEGRLGLDLWWIAHRGRVYQITGMSPADRFEPSLPVLRRIARSFRPLSAAERSEIRATRLRIVRARRGESLSRLAERMQAAWKPPEVAVANALSVDAPLREGQVLKVALFEPYRPSGPRIPR
jgi:predicted Zn-dependent protease